MPRLEEITYEAGRAALADQESRVSDIRQRTGTLLAAQALVASFLGSAAINGQRFDVWSWLALVAFVVGLVLAAAVLAPWSLTFAVDPRDLYRQLQAQAADEVSEGTLVWLVAAALLYRKLRQDNRATVELISRCSAGLGAVMVVQTLLWLLALGLD